MRTKLKLLIVALVVVMPALTGCTSTLRKRGYSSVKAEERIENVQLVIKKSQVPDVLKELDAYLGENITEIDPSYTPEGEDRIVVLMFDGMKRENILSQFEAHVVRKIEDMQVGLHHQSDLAKKTPKALLIETFAATKNFKMETGYNNATVKIAMVFED